MPVDFLSPRTAHASRATLGPVLGAWDSLRIQRIAGRAAVAAAARRVLTRERTRPSWDIRLEAVSAALRAVSREAYGRPTPQVRAIWTSVARAAPTADRTRQEPASLDGLEGRWFYPDAPATDGAPVLLYLHGGAYQFGSVYTHRELVANLAQASGCPTLAIDYRLAPEHPYPAAIEDALRAVRWLRARGVARLALAGDSAGGNLTLATTLRLRDAGDPPPDRLVLLCPWVDLARESPSVTRNRDADWIVEDANLRWSATYRAGEDPRNPFVSPIFADLRDLPPTLLQVGTAEMLYDEALELAERAREVGAPLRLSAYEDMIHDFQTLTTMRVPEARRAIDEIGAFLREA